MVHTLAAPGGLPWRQKKTGQGLLELPGTHKARRHASQGAPRDPQGAKTIVFDLMPDAPGPPLEPYFEKTSLFENPQKTKGISLFLHQALPFGSLNMVSRTLLGPSNFVHASPKHLQGCLKDPPSTSKVVRRTSEIKKIE